MHTSTTQSFNILLSLKVELCLQPLFIGKTKCSYKAGLGQCNHLIGLLYTLAHYVKMGATSVPPTTSKQGIATSNPFIIYTRSDATVLASVFSMTC